MCSRIPKPFSDQIDDFMKLYIRDGYYSGLRYIFNTYGICELTGTKLSDIESEKFTKKDLEELKLIVQKRNMVSFVTAHSKIRRLCSPNISSLNNGLKADDFLANLAYEEG